MPLDIAELEETTLHYIAYCLIMSDICPSCTSNTFKDFLAYNITPLPPYLFLLFLSMAYADNPNSLCAKVVLSHI